MVLPFRAEERTIFDQEIIQRDAAVLDPVAQQQLAEAKAAAAGKAADPAELLVPVLISSAAQEGMLGVAIYDAEGSKIQSAPASLLLPELPPGDYPRLLGGQAVSRYTPDFPLDRYFAGIAGPPNQRVMPVLEVLLPLHGHDASRILGFIQYYIDARKLAAELSIVDRRFDRETAVTLGIGAGLVAIVLTSAFFGLRRAQRIIAERNERLTRANFELTLAAKASALGQIASHLIHGLQGPVAGLRAVVDGHTDTDGKAGEWRSAADYTQRLQAMIQDTVALLGDTEAQVSYPLTGKDLAHSLRKRNASAAADKGVSLGVSDEFDVTVDSYRGSLLCLIGTNLIQNAIAATPSGRCVDVALRHSNGALTLSVTDQGAGIPESIRPHLFEPGRSGRAGGTGLGLAISQLLARQIGASLALVETNGEGTTFRLTLSL